jgi:predicted HNH restriction endonuclease
MYEHGAKQLRWLAEVEKDARPGKSWRFECDYRVVSVFEPPIPIAALASDKTFSQWGTYRAHFQGSAFEIPAPVWSVIERVARISESGTTGRAKIARVFTQAFYDEGFRRETLTNRAERSAKLVEDAKRVHGTICRACGFDFGSFYGQHGAGFIEMHHKKPVAKLRRGGATNPKDVVPLCANCHRMVHRGQEILTVARLRRIIARAQPRGAKRGR